MKKLNSLKLNQLSKAEIEKNEMGLIVGGTCTCSSYCGCLYAGGQCSSGDSYYGGSSVDSNWYANLSANGRGNSQ